MGLDAYIEVRAYDKKTHTKMLEIEISYFRKYRHLQAFMEDLYYNKYNGEELFNTIPLELEKSDILDLEDSCRRNMEEYSDASGVKETLMVNLVRKRKFLKPLNGVRYS